MNNNLAVPISFDNNPIPPALLSLPQEDQKASLRVRFNALMLGYLALNKFSDDPRWITVVTSQDIDKQSYKSLFGGNFFGDSFSGRSFLGDTFNKDMVRLRIIRAKPEDLLWITWQCLAQGNSYAVISTLDSLDPEEYQQLQDAAKIGNCTYHQV